MPAINHQYDQVIAAAAQVYGVDPALVKGHMAAESNFNPRAYRAEPKLGDASYGLMQLLHQTAARYSNVEVPTDADQANLTGLYDPGVNIPIAAHLIADNLAATGGNVDAAIAAYNEGLPRALDDAATGRPWRTYDPNYVAKVKSYQAAYAGDFADGGATTAPDATGTGSALPEILVGLAITGLLTLLLKRWIG